MAGSADIALSGEMYLKVLEISTILGDLSEGSECLSTIIQDVASFSNYQGNSSEELLVFYRKLREHTDTITFLYGMALQ